jgi:hypothetical protein
MRVVTTEMSEMFFVQDVTISPGEVVFWLTPQTDFRHFDGVRNRSHVHAQPLLVRF